MAGRPSKYNETTLEIAEDYLHNYEAYGCAFPSIIGLSLALDVHRDTVHAWGNDEDKPEFSDILEKINKLQQQVAWQKGLTGEYNANLVKLLLGKHGYSDKIEQDNTSSDGSLKLPTQIVLVGKTEDEG